ncbi:MarR family winged helix-turn-helix transcriptional regulator [Roseateles toxinivorans]|uniref:MarR family winged helix-turn-helix transcriptional regulator n=1 Tax=Roseateles toxinivorans TaxID=270368 RepID=UPI001414D65A|nr:MarR family transcriptional regulator [Roseateles toxinivorans]
MNPPAVYGLKHPQQLEDLLMYRLTRVVRTCGLPLVRLFEGELGITRREWHVLALVVQEGALAPSRIAELCWLDRPRVSRAVGRLVERGLLSRQAAGRSALVRATAEGNALYARAMAEAGAFNEALVDDLDATEMAQLDALLNKLQSRAQTLRDAPMPGRPVQRHAGGTRDRHGTTESTSTPR